MIAQVAGEEILSDSQPLCGVIDLDTLREQVRSLAAAYDLELPVLHTVAAKSVTLVPVLREFAQLGMGCEVATRGELRLALLAGFAAERIVYDAPAKTYADLEEALSIGVALNADNFSELDRIDVLRRRGGVNSKLLGLRINPQTGSGAIAAMSTATSTSKFGVGLADAREEIVQAYLDRPWMNLIHVHSGSQGIELVHAAEGVRLVVELALEINTRAGKKQISHIDIGGGLPVNFSDDRITPTFEEHRRVLERTVPELFSGEYAIITEFGRSLTAKSGTIIGRVEYVKDTGGRRIALTHIGVQVATRTVFDPESWPLRVEVYDRDGMPKTADAVLQDVAGPACFSGDLVASGRMLPLTEEGDLVAVPDTGGYYFSTHYSYNALPWPAVYCVEGSGDDRALRLIRASGMSDEQLAASEISFT